MRGSILRISDISTRTEHPLKSMIKLRPKLYMQPSREHGRKVPVTSIKSMIGHTLGAAGAIEAAATVLTLHRGIIPPTINHYTRDPECNLNIVANEARESKITAAHLQFNRLWRAKRSPRFHSVDLDAKCASPGLSIKPLSVNLNAILRFACIHKSGTVSP